MTVRKSAKIERKCDSCGCAFYVYPSALKNYATRFCSNRCKGAGNAAKPDADRFWPRVNKDSPNGCWEWTGANNGVGYGVLKPKGRGKMMLATRISYEMHHGPIPDGMYICHKCDNPPCVNPDHLFLGTPSDNMRDCSCKGRVRNQFGRAPAKASLVGRKAA